MNFIYNINNNFKRLCKDLIVLIFSYSSSNNKLYLCNYEHSYSDIYNLRLVNKTLVDDIEPIADPLIESMLSRISNIFYFETWGYISIAFSFLIIALFLTYYFANDSRIKRITFISLCISFILISITLVNVYKGYNNYINIEYAIIFSYETDLKTEPNNRSETLFMLHEGTKVQLLENYNNWIKIQLVNGQIGFIQLIDAKIL